MIHLFKPDPFMFELQSISFDTRVKLFAYNKIERGIKQEEKQCHFLICRQNNLRY